MVTFIRSDLEFILAQIIIAEQNADGEALIDILPNVQVPWGLRTVDGSFNNLIDGQSEFGAADNLFPRLTDPIFRDADADTSYADSGLVIELDATHDQQPDRRPDRQQPCGLRDRLRSRCGRHPLSPPMGLNFLTELENNSFSKMVMANTDVTHLPDAIFSTPTWRLEVDPTKQSTGLGAEGRDDPTGGTFIVNVEDITEIFGDQGLHDHHQRQRHTARRQ